MNANGKRHGREGQPLTVQANDDVLTVVAISLVAESLADVLHEGWGHATTTLLTGEKSGVLSTVERPHLTTDVSLPSMQFFTVVLEKGVSWTEWTEKRCHFNPAA